MAIAKRIISTDIEKGLEERLARFDALELEEEARHKAALAAIKADRSLVRNMLEFERRNKKGVQPAEALKLHPNAQNRIEHEILDFLRDGDAAEHAAIKEMLIEEALGSSADPNFGRSVQGTLLSMRARDLVELVDERVWGITKKGKAGFS
jgi:hypothetical protein